MIKILALIYFSEAYWGQFDAKFIDATRISGAQITDVPQPSDAQISSDAQIR